MKDLDSAEYYYLVAIKLAESAADAFEMMSLYGNYSLIPALKGDYETSILYCKKALVIAESLGDIKSLITAHKHLYET